MKLELPDHRKTEIEVGMKWRQVFGSRMPTPGQFRIKLKAHLARIKRLAANAYKRANEKAYDQRLLRVELRRMPLILFLAGIVINNAGTIISI
jgi:hypothetical protein